MSIQQLNHMWQISRSGEFEEYNPDFCEPNGDQIDPVDFPLEDIFGVVVTNFYVKDDSFCDPATQQVLLDDLSSYKFTTMNEDITHITIAAANDQTPYLNLLKFSLTQGSNIDINGSCSGFDNLDWL